MGWALSAGSPGRGTERMKLATFQTPNVMSMKPTASSIARPRRAGITRLKKNNRRADDQNRDRMTKSPEGANQRRSPGLALLTDNGCHRNHVIRVGSMAHPEKETNRDDGEKTKHAFTSKARTSNADKYQVTRMSLYAWLQTLAGFEECRTPDA